MKSAKTLFENAEPVFEANEQDKAAYLDEKKKKRKQELIEWIKDIAFAVLVAVIVLQFVMPTIVNQHSMENTLMEGDYIFVSKKAYKWFGEPKRGDIVVFQSDLPLENSKDDKLLVKRVIALAGDTIVVKNGNVYLNGEQLSEEYIKDGLTNGEIDTTIPEGYLFCMGDNRLVSRDSRDPSIGLVSEESLRGKVVFRLFPLSKIGGLYK